MDHASDCKCKSCEGKRMTTKAGAAAQMLKLIGFDENDLRATADMIADAALMTKSMPGSETGDMPTVKDRWDRGEMHMVPSGETIKVGPGQSASGGGAEHMVSVYANPAPQKGVTLEAERLAAELGSMHGYAKAIADGHNGLCKSFDGLSSVIKNIEETNRRLTAVCLGLVKKAEEKEEGDDDEEKEEKIEINAAKAQESYVKARALLKKSRSIRAQMKAAQDAGHISALKAQAKLFKNAAKAYFSKAAQYATAGKSRAVVTRKALDEFFAANPALKADVDPAVDAKSLAKAAKKARADWEAAIKAAEVVKKDDDAGNQDDKENKENGNQDDSAAKAAVAELSGKVDAALKGFGMLQTDMQGLMATLSGRPVTAKVEPLAIVKGDPQEVVRKIDARIESYASEHRLDQAMEHRARDVLSKYVACQRGEMTDAAFKSYLGASPPSVQEIFQAAA